MSWQIKGSNQYFSLGLNLAELYYQAATCVEAHKNYI